MSRAVAFPRTRREPSRPGALAEVETLAWLLDSSIPVPGTGGRRLGLDAVIGLVPFVGDIAGGAIGLFIVWRGSRMGVPRIVVARMLANSVVDLLIGAIPFAGDAFDLWFKANTRNLGLIRRHVEDPSASTRSEWLAIGALVGTLVAVVLAIGWLVVSVVSAVVGLFA
jgi:hypothetical protein